MSRFLEWSEIERALDDVAADDHAGIVAVFLEHEGRALEARDARGARQTLNVSSFCARFGLRRATFAKWIKAHGRQETA